MMHKMNYIHVLRPYEKKNRRMNAYGLFEHDSFVTLRITNVLFENCKIDYYGKLRVRSAFKPYSAGQKFEVYVDEEARVIELKPID